MAATDPQVRWWRGLFPAFRPDAPDERAAARFVAAARERWGLSPSGARVLLHLCAGHTSRDALAAASGRALGTVKRHLHDINEALGAASATHAVMLAWPVYQRTRNGQPIAHPARQGGN